MSSCDDNGKDNKQETGVEKTCKQNVARSGNNPANDNSGSQSDDKVYSVMRMSIPFPPYFLREKKKYWGGVCSKLVVVDYLFNTYLLYCRRSLEINCAHVVQKRSIKLVVDQSVGYPLIS